MAETLELKQVVCPNCKQPFIDFDPFQLEIECSYCHTKSLNPLITAKKEFTPERLIPFNTSEKDFEQALIKNLIEHDFVPIDIFKKIIPQKVIKAYLPMYLYEIKYSSDWSCEVAIKPQQNNLYLKRAKGEVPKKSINFTPQSGTTHGNFSGLCLAYEGNSIPSELEEFCKQYSYEGMLSKDFDFSLLETEAKSGTMIFTSNTDAEFIWDKYGNDCISKFVKQNVYKHFNGKEIINFKSLNSYTLYNHGRYVLAPFWFVYYIYDNKKFYFAMDGFGNDSAISTPVDPNEEKFFVKKEKAKNIITSFAIITMILCLLTFYDISFASFIPLLIVETIIFGDIDKKIKKRLEHSRMLRKIQSESL